MVLFPKYKQNITRSFLGIVIWSSYSNMYTKIMYASNKIHSQNEIIKVIKMIK